MKCALRLSCSLFLALLPCAAFAQKNGDLLTVDQAIDESVQHNLDFLAQKYDLSIAEAEIITARLRPNPILTLDGDHLDWLGTKYNPHTNNAGPQEYSVRGDYLYERGGKRQARTALATDVRDVTRLQLADSVRGLIQSVENSFVDALSAKNTLQMMQENLKTFHDIVEVDQVRVKDGDIAEVELMRAEVAELQFANSVRQAQLQENTAMAKLQLLLGRSQKAFDITGDLRKEDMIPDRLTLLTSAMQQRPDLQALLRDEDRAAADIRLQKANAKVDWTFGSEYRRQDSSTARGDSVGLFIQSPVPFFDRNQGEVARSRQAYLQAQGRTTALKATIANDVDQALLAYNAAKDTLQKIEGTMLDKAKNVRQISEYSYKRGDIQFVEFLDAVRAYNDTMQTYNDARADYARSLYGLDAATGASTAAGKVQLP